MRGELTLLAGLLSVAALVRLTNELSPDGFVAGYAFLAWLFVGGAVAYWMYYYTRRPVRLDLWAVLFIASAAFFASGGVVGPRSTGVSAARVSLAVQALLLLAVGLIAARAGFRLVSPVGGAGFRKAALCARIQATRPVVVLALWGLIWTLRGYAFSQGLVLSHAGDVMSEVGTGASIAIQLALLGRPLVVFLGAVLAMDRRPARRALGLLVVGGELLYSVLWARRLLLDLIAALLLAGIWTGRRLGVRRLAVYGAVGVFAIVVMWPFMFHLRKVADQAGLYGADFATRSDTLLVQVLPDAIATFDLATSLSEGSEYRENVHDRTRMLDLLLDISAAHQAGTPFMHGQVFAAALVSTVPRVLWPDKERLMAVETWQVEELIERHFALPIIDMASTVLTHGYADGGVLGVVLYMALFGLALGLAERIFGKARNALIGLAVYAMALSLAVQIEGNITDVFAVARVVAVLVVIDRLAGRWLERLSRETRGRVRATRPAWAM
ncbi:MAG TPA: hypothetical protein VJU81_05005 [Methylomirabilota bacterium]|nr:hypothetical protein [Methylomirabilota bacterium]